MIFLILVFVNFTIYPIFALTPNDPGIIVVAGTSDREMAYTSSDGNAAIPANKRNLKLTRTTLPDICNFTIGVDVKIDVNTNTNITTYPIPIFYRGSVPVGLTDASAANVNKVSSTYNNTNIILWADGTTKEIQLTIVTTDVNGDSVEQSMAKTIEPIFAPKWFRITVVLASTFAEVYLNGSLISTLSITNTLKQINNTDFYPPVVTPDVGGITIANMSMWPRLLTSKEIRAYESAPMSS
jgi:hypothetical protein